MSQIFGSKRKGGATVQDAVNAVSNLLNGSVVGDLEKASKAVTKCAKGAKSFKGLIECVDGIEEPTTRELARGIVLGVVRTLDQTVTDWNTLKKNADAIVSKAAFSILMTAFGQQTPAPVPA